MPGTHQFFYTFFPVFSYHAVSIVAREDVTTKQKRWIQVTLGVSFDITNGTGWLGYTTVGVVACTVYTPNVQISQSIKCIEWGIRNGVRSGYKRQEALQPISSFNSVSFKAEMVGYLFFPYLNCPFCNVSILKSVTAGTVFFSPSHFRDGTYMTGLIHYHDAF